MGNGFFVSAIISISLLLLTAAPGSVQALDPEPPRPPTNDEWGAMVFVNQFRADPWSVTCPNGTPIVASSPKTPLAWSPHLAAAAIFHSEDKVAHDPACQTQHGWHDSCDGTVWYQRVWSYYGVAAVAENVAGYYGGTAEGIQWGFYCDPSHQTNMLSGYTEFGAGIATAPPDGAGIITNDFGNLPTTIPAIPAAVVDVRQGGTSPRKFAVNYFDASGAPPDSVNVRIGSSCKQLTQSIGGLLPGTAGFSATYFDMISVTQSGCIPAVFEIVSGGTTYQWPEGESILVGVNATSCAERSTEMPVADCGNAPPPPPPPSSGPGGVPTTVVVTRAKNIQAVTSVSSVRQCQLWQGTKVLGRKNGKSPYIFLSKPTAPWLLKCFDQTHTLVEMSLLQQP